MEDPRALIARGPMHPRQVLAVAIATALNALDGFDVLSISFASPAIAKAWGISRATLGLVLSMELVGMGLGAIVLGSAADRAGRRPVILCALAVMALGMLLASNAHNVATLSIYRLLTGLGIGGMLAATNAVVAEYSNARWRNLAVAVMAGGYPMGAVIGGTIAAALLRLTGRWEAIFLFGALLTLGFIPLVLFYLPETIAFLLEKRPPSALEKVNRIMTLQGRAPLACLPAAEAPTERTSGVRRLFTAGIASVTALLTLAYFGHMMTFYFLMKWIPKVVSDMGFTPAAASGVLVWANVGGAAGAVTLSLFTQRFGVRPLVVAAMVGGAAAVAAFGQGFATLGALSAVACVAGFFTNGATAGLYAILAQSFPTPLRARGTGLVIGVGRAGAALGPITAGLLFTAGWPLSAVAPMLAAGTLIGSGALALGRGLISTGPEPG